MEKVLLTIGNNDKWCVEFGAWDGTYLSNTRHLIESAGYSAILIEGSKEKFEILLQNYRTRSNVTALNKYVGFDESSGLDSILASTEIPLNFDFLSIDIDGNDYHVWNSILKYRPKLVCIEFNPTIPTEAEFVQNADRAINQGASLKALVQLGKKKSYELVSVLHCNALFVDSQYFPLLGIDDNSPEALRDDTSAVTYLFSGYDGTIFLRGSGRLPWHGAVLLESKVQHLPRFLRKYPGNYNRFEALAFRMFGWLKLPRQLLERVCRRLNKRDTL